MRSVRTTAGSCRAIASRARRPASAWATGQPRPWATRPAARTRSAGVSSTMRTVFAGPGPASGLGDMVGVSGVGLGGGRVRGQLSQCLLQAVYLALEAPQRVVGGVQVTGLAQRLQLLGGRDGGAGGEVGDTPLQAVRRVPEPGRVAASDGGPQLAEQARAVVEEDLGHLAEQPLAAQLLQGRGVVEGGRGRRAAG